MGTDSQFNPSRRYVLNEFGLSDMIECGRFIRSTGGDARSMQDAARILVSYFYLVFRRSDASDCALARCFKTQRLSTLPMALQAKARTSLADRAHSDTLPCLTLLATAGDEAAWNDPQASSGHAVIPLESAEAVSRAPMIAQLLRQLGLEVETVIRPSEELILEAEERTYGVFHVEEAAGSSYIPAQQTFVHKYGIQSVLGFGGLLPSGDLFVVIIFSKVRISRETANLFRTLALSVKLVLLPFTWGPFFESDSPPEKSTKSRTPEQDQTRSEIGTLRLLIPALEVAALYQTSRLQDVISDLHQQRAAFEKLGTRLSSMLESTTDAVFILNREWHFTYLNQHALRLLRTDTGVLGKNIWEEFPAAIQNNFRSQYSIAMEKRVAVKFKEHYPAPLDRWFEVHVFPSEEGIAVFFHDITDRLKAEAALMKNEKLAAVGRLAASIAHEINNPLESVTNLLYLARTSTEPSMIQEFLDTADRELRRVGAITTQTLRFHKQSTSPVEVTCKELLEGVLSIYQGRVVNSHVRVERLEKTTKPLFCFDGEIRQVLNNLVGNAIDAMHPEGGRLLLRSRDATDWRTGRKGMALTVADTGPGMSPQVLAKAAEPFFTTKGIGGSGLGLWISREILTRHEGWLRLWSSQLPERSGTVVTVFIPSDATVR